MKQNCESCKLKGVGLFCNLSAAAKKEFERIRFSAMFPADATLFRESDESRGVFVLCSGQVKLSVSSSCGKTLILRIAKPGEMLGLTASLADGQYELTAETLHSCQVAFIRREEFHKFVAQFPEVYAAVIRQISKQYEYACDQLRTVGLSASAHEKLARLLVQWSSDGIVTKEGTQIRVPLTHEQIAECVGSSRETITRILGDFKRERLISPRGATLTILDPAALQMACGF